MLLNFIDCRIFSCYTYFPVRNSLKAFEIKKTKHSLKGIENVETLSWKTMYCILVGFKFIVNVLNIILMKYSIQFYLQCYIFMLKNKHLIVIQHLFIFNKSLLCIQCNIKLTDIYSSKIYYQFVYLLHCHN